MNGAADQPDEKRASMMPVLVNSNDCCKSPCQIV